MLEAGSLAAVDAGAATHLVLQHLDFRRSCDRADIEAQIAEFVERKFIAQAQADVVEVEAIVWLMSTQLGELLRRHADSLLRELPAYMAERPHDSADPQDHVMLRGRIDALIPADGGSILIDYKTDRVEASDVVAHAASYAGQAGAYRRAVEAITMTPVEQVLLVFLHARAVHRI
jgi:ATP-dependent helicase/nuclease subunit A